MQFSLCSFHCAVLIAVDAGNQSARTLYPVPEQSIREHVPHHAAGFAPVLHGQTESRQHEYAKE